MKTHTTDWFNAEYSALQKDGRSWGNADMYDKKLDCLKWAFDISSLQKDASILDVGCGDGELARTLRRNRYTNIDGIDISEVAIKKALLDKEGDFTAGDFTKEIEFKKKYDCIFDTDCLHMVIEASKRTSFLQNVRNGLHDEGIFLTGINSSKDGLNPYVEIKDVVQYYFPVKSTFAEEVVTSGFELIATRDLPARNKKQCDLWSEMIFRKSANDSSELFGNSQQQ